MELKPIDSVVDLLSCFVHFDRADAQSEITSNLSPEASNGVSARTSHVNLKSLKGFARVCSIRKPKIKKTFSGTRQKPIIRHVSSIIPKYFTSRYSSNVTCARNSYTIAFEGNGKPRGNKHSVLT